MPYVTFFSFVAAAGVIDLYGEAVGLKRLLEWALQEWLFLAGLTGLLLSVAWFRRLPRYSSDELQVLFLLWLLFVAVKGIEQSGLTAWVARYLERGGFLAVKLVLITFFLAALVTNDVALVIVVPLTLAMNTKRKGALVMLEAFAANAGSALTPFGNPQNLYLYWHYSLQPLDFFLTITPFSMLFLLIFLAAAALISVPPVLTATPGSTVERSAGAYLLLLALLVLVVLRLLPFPFAYAVALGVFAFGKRALRVDYWLLLTFLVFFGLVDVLKPALEPLLAPAGHVFATAALTSQAISNVPATILLAEFTSNWRALLWGVSVGGFGSLIASFANLIAYRFYLTHQSDPAKRRAFTVRFLVYGYLLFGAGAALYYVLY